MNKAYLKQLVSRLHYLQHNLKKRKVYDYRVYFISYLNIAVTWTGVERLAGMSLTDPLRIDVSNAEEENSQSNSESSKTQKNENFVVPEKLRQSFVITPCKLRLVTLTAFILLKMKVGFIPTYITCKSVQMDKLSL